MKLQWRIVFLALAVGMLLFPSFVGAHSYMELSSPQEDSTVDESPSGVWVQFTEPIETDLSQLRIENEDGEVIEAEQYSVDNTSMTLRLPHLENGEYTVYWQILALDTHVTDGSFRFFVEVEELVEPEVEEPVVDIVEEPEVEEDVQEEPLVDEEQQDQEILEEEQEQSWPLFSRINMGLRIIEIVTVMFLGGWIFFQGFLWRKEGVSLLEDQHRYPLFEKRLFLLGFLLILMTSVGHLASRSFHLTQTTISDPFLWETLWLLLTTTIIGKVCLLKPILAGVVYMLSLRKNPIRWLQVLLLIGLLVTFGYTGHAYHSEKIGTHTIHMLAIVIWFGGLLGFVVSSFLVKKNEESLLFIHKRLKIFSTIALVSVVIITLTGLFLSNVYLESWGDLIGTQYGQILLWKVGIFALVIPIAVAHRFLWLPKLGILDTAEEKEGQVKKLFFGLRLELVLVIIVLVIAGMLTTASPPADIHGENHYYYH
ncbi:copper resistance CopC/CopD family protein [Bacillus alkalicellulosilyticus]|uniref:copper resistance CopC/CopD family protein n=1 Tax=Alkalihalobacterium alkalicellulosilyticum TaxID=1912214 RepID=UPI000998B158|nr:CopD family protein [Bacillus alkalicellulosilyticus]